MMLQRQTKKALWLDANKNLRQNLSEIIDTCKIYALAQWSSTGWGLLYGFSRRIDLLRNEMGLVKLELDIKLTGPAPERSTKTGSGPSGR